MLPPLVSRLVSDPSLAIEHARRYAALTEAELAYAGRCWQRRLLAAVAAVVLLAGGVMLAGVALLIAQGPGAQAGWQAGVGFWAVPLLPLALGAVAMRIALRPAHPAPFDTLRAQLAQDAGLLVPPESAEPEAGSAPVAAQGATTGDAAGPSGPVAGAAPAPQTATREGAPS